MKRFFPTIKISYLIFLSFLMGGGLTFLRLPLIFDWLRPFWIVLILLYWALMRPHYVNVKVAWVVGILLDMVSGTLVGEHALALILIVFLITELQQKLIPLGFWSMSLVIWGLLMLYQLLLFLMQACAGHAFNFWSIFGGALVSAVIWPLLALLLFNYQQKLRI